MTGLRPWPPPCIANPNSESDHVKKEVSIHIGEFYVSEEPTVIYTLLGSCVAVCLHHPDRKTGGMNHILLPGKSVSPSDADPLRYARNAIEVLISSVMGLGGARSRLVAKIFGGARLLTSISKDRGVGRSLSEFVMDFLKVEKIPIISQDVGGTDVRKIYFHTDTGEVFLKRIPAGDHRRFLEQEQERLRLVDSQVRNTGTWYPWLPER